VVFIQRMKYVPLSFSCNDSHLWMTDAQVRSGAPNVPPDPPSKRHSKRCAVEGRSREDRYSRLSILTRPYTATPAASYYYI
jgi:hypothetical protein